MSSSTVTTIQNQLNNYGYPIFLVLGSIGNVFIIILFNQHRQNACSLYLTSSAVVNILYLIYNGFTQIFPFDFGNGTKRAITLCQIDTFMVNFIGQIAKTMIILACVDRFMMTHDRVSFRLFSTPKRAKYIILLSFIFCSLFSIHVPFMKTIVHGQCSTSGIYSIILTTYVIIFVGLIPPILMGTFGYLTYRNIKKRHIRVQPVVNNANDPNVTIQQRDRDLLILVMSEVIFYIITAAPLPIIFLEKMISEYVISNKSFQYFQIEILILNIANLLLFINSAAPFYIYFISSKAFRRDFKQLFIKVYQKLRREPPVQVAPTMNTIAATKRETRV